MACCGLKRRRLGLDDGMEDRKPLLKKLDVTRANSQADWENSDMESKPPLSSPSDSRLVHTVVNLPPERCWATALAIAGFSATQRIRWPGMALLSSWATSHQTVQKNLAGRERKSSTAKHVFFGQERRDGDCSCDVNDG